MNGKIRTYPDFSLPRLLTSQWGWLLSLAVFVYIIVMLNLEHPFGDHVEVIPHHHWLLLGFGWVCLVIYLVFYYVLPLVFEDIFDRENAITVKEMIYMGLFTLIMFVANLVYVMLVIPPPDITPDYLLHILYFTVAFNFVPVFALNALRKICLLKLKVNIPEEIPEILPEKQVLSVPVDLTELKGRIYESEEIKYFEVYGNYLITHFDSKDETEHEMLTGSMKHLEKLLALHPEFQRSHRSYLVNTSKMQKCIGNKAGIKFWLHNCNIEFNVYHKKISTFLPFVQKTKKGNG